MLHVDYLSFVFPVENLGSVASLLEQDFGAPARTHGGRWYREGLEFGAGVWIAYSVADEDGGAGKPEAHCTIKGSALAQKEASDVLEMMMNFPGIGAKGRRVDVCYDDAAKEIHPRELWRDYVSGGSFSGARCKRYVEGGDEAGGSGVYLGKRGREGSGLQLCVYDKSAESGGAIDAIRWETRYYDQRAEDAFDRLCFAKDVEDFTRRIGELVASQWEFWEDADAHHLSRRKRAQWWERIKGRLRLDSIPDEDK